MLVGFEQLPTFGRVEDLHFYIKPDIKIDGTRIGASHMELRETLTRHEKMRLSVIKKFLCFCEFPERRIPSIYRMAELAKMIPAPTGCPEPHAYVAYMVLDWVGMDLALRKKFKKHVLFFREYDKVNGWLY